MNLESSDPLVEALRLCRQTLPPLASEPCGGSGPGGPPDVGELFLAELQTRRQRLEDWLRLLGEQACRERGIPVRRFRPRVSARRCRCSP